MSYLESNLKYLCAIGAITPHEAGIIRTAALGKQYRMEPAGLESGCSTLAAVSDGNLCYFHDRDIPVATARRKAGNIREDQTGLFQFGVGLGYELEAALSMCPWLNIVAIVEYEPALIKIALDRFDLSEYRNIQWFIWVGDLSEANVNRFLGFDEVVGGRPVAAVSNPAFMKINSLFFERYQHTFQMTEHLDVVQRILEKSGKKAYESRISYEYLFQQVYEIPFPDVIRIEPTNFCNLNCTICPTPKYPKENKGFMDMRLYERILEELRQMDPACKYYIILYLGGEPLMHKEICEMIRMASSIGYFTHLNTNSTVLTEDLSERLILAGLSRIHFSFDDFTPEQHASIRIGSDRGKAYGNILKFIEIRRRLGSETPAQIIAALKIPAGEDMKRGEVRPSLSEEFTRLWMNQPVTIMGSWAHHWASDFIARADGLHPLEPLADYYPCGLLWRDISIRWDGTVVPCCYDLRSEQSLGKFPDRPLSEIWNGGPFTELRQAHVTGRVNKIPLCRGCSILHSTYDCDKLFGEDAHVYKKHAF